MRGVDITSELELEVMDKRVYTMLPSVPMKAGVDEPDLSLRLFVVADLVKVLERFSILKGRPLEQESFLAEQCRMATAVAEVSNLTF